MLIDDTRYFAHKPMVVIVCVDEEYRYGILSGVFMQDQVREAVKAGTEKLFPGDVQFKPVDDPEIPGAKYFSVRCGSDRDLDEILVGYNEWHRLLPTWAPGSERLFRLSVDAVE